jgi:hypothetical protein
MEAQEMFSYRIMTRNVALAGAVTFLLGSPVFAQDHGYDNHRGNREYANRNIEGTVESVVHDRNGEHVRLTSGMDLFVPNSVTGLSQGRRYGAAG